MNILVRWTLFALFSLSCSIPQCFANHGYHDFEGVVRGPVFDGHLHAVSILQPVSFGFDGTMHVGIGIGNPDYTSRTSPSLSLGGDYTSKIIRLPSHDRELFHVPANEHAYVVIKNARLEIAIGASVSVQMPGAWALYASVAPRVGGALQIEKYVDSPDEANTLTLQLPYVMRDTEAWSVGDSLTYSTKLGLSASAGVGVSSLLRAGGFYSADGETMVNVRKVAPYSLQVTIFRNTSHNFGGLISCPLAILQGGGIRQNVRNYSFVFDFNEPDVEHSYQELMWGRLEAAEQMAQVEHSGVSDASYTLSKAHGSGLTAAVGLPLLHMNEFNRKKLDIASFKVEGAAPGGVAANLAFLSKTTSTNGVASHHLLKH